MPSSPTRFAAVAIGLLAVLVFGIALYGAQRGTSTADIAPVAPEEQTAVAAQQPAPSSGGPVEGIKVHGRWTIEVRNTDGTLASRAEFNNAYVGGPTLSRLLARSISVGKWEVFLSGGPSIGPCGSIAGAGLDPLACIVAEPGIGLPLTPNLFETLGVSVPFTGADSGKFVLSGTATALANSSVSSVLTQLVVCAPSSPPSTPCAFGTPANLEGGQPLTSTTLATPIAVSTGQQIQVKVVISFQ